jgi:outer membrane lipoprotein SlyB
VKTALFIPALGVLLALTGCATRPTSGPVYPVWQTNTALTTEEGVVLGVKKVTIEGTSSATGSIAGGAIGAGVGMLAAGGSGYGYGAEAAIGTGLGAVIGPHIEKMITAKPGLEITVRLANGDVIVVVQEEDFAYRDGDIVRVIRGGGYARVLP